MAGWKIIKSKVLVNNYYCKLVVEKVVTSKGKIIPKYFLVSHRDVVMIVPVTKSGKFVLIREYKHGIKKSIFLFPAGLVSEKETPRNAAIRELGEETGYIVNKIERLGILYEYPSNETQKVFVFLAKNLPEKPNGKKRSEEETKLYYFFTNELEKLVLENRFRLATSVSAFYLAINKLVNKK